MPIPDFQTLLLPVLRLASDNAEHTITGSADHIATELQLTDQEREAVYDSGSGLNF